MAVLQVSWGIGDWILTFLLRCARCPRFLAVVGRQIVRYAREEAVGEVRKKERGRVGREENLLELAAVFKIVCLPMTNESCRGEMKFTHR